MRRPGRRLVTTALVSSVAAAFASPSAAMAHGLGGRSDLPIPTWLLAWASITVVAFTFVTSVLLWTEPSMAKAAPGRPVAPARPLVPVLSAISRFVVTGLFVLAIAAGITGSADAGRNIAAVVLYAVVWVGMQLLAPFVGDIWNTSSPFATLGRLIPGRWRVEPSGWWATTHWPAAIGIGAFAWLELSYHTSASPRVVGWSMLG